MATTKEKETGKTTKKVASTKATTAKKATTSKSTPKTTTTTKTTAAKKTTTSKTTPKKAATTKSTTTKKTATTKATTKKTAAKTTSKAIKKTTDTKVPKVVKTTNTGIKIEQKGNEGNLLDILGAVTSTPTPVEPAKPKSSTKKTPSKAAPKKEESKTKKAASPARVLKKAKTLTKEEKVLYKRLEEAFNYVANLTMVIEERTLDTKQVSDLTLGELHVLEVINKEATIPMTKVANQLKITVGSLTTCVNRLVKKEYLFRERDEVDHRIIKVSTTQKAKKVLKVHDIFHEQILIGLLEGVTIRDATKVMAQLVRTLENYINPKEKNYENPIDTKKKKNI